MAKVRPNGPSNGSAMMRTPAVTTRSYSACASLALHQSWMLVVSGDGPGCPGRRADESANVGQPTNATASGPKSNVSRTAPTCCSENDADLVASVTAIEIKPG